MIRSATMLGVLRREALPLVLACALALMLQLAAMPLTLAKAGGEGSEALSVLCLGSADADAETQPVSQSSHHVPGFCPCGPVCAHSGSLLSVTMPSVAETVHASYVSRLQPLRPGSEPARAGRAHRSGAIRGPPPART